MRYFKPVSVVEHENDYTFSINYFHDCGTLINTLVSMDYLDGTINDIYYVKNLEIQDSVVVLYAYKVKTFIVEDSFNISTLGLCVTGKDFDGSDKIVGHIMYCAGKYNSFVLVKNVDKFRSGCFGGPTENNIGMIVELLDNDTYGINKTN